MKRISSLVVVLALLICFASAYITTATAASPGTAADPLAAVSYLTRTLLPSILADVQAFSGKKVPADDITLLITEIVLPF
jgi:hypothetical protein